MSDFGTMKTRIADEIARSTLTSQISAAILTTIKHYERKRFYFNAKTTSFVTVANQEDYGSAALSDIPNIIEIDEMRVVVGGSKLPVYQIGYEVLSGSQDGNIKSYPERWAYYAQKLWLFPIPNDVYTMPLSYVYRLASLSADGDTNAWMTDGEELIREGAKRRLFTSLLFDSEGAAGSALLEKEALDGIVSETRRRRGKAKLGTDVPVGSGGYNISYQ